MLNESELSRRARAYCLAHAQKRVMGDLTVTATGSHLDWDEFQMRHVFSQAMTIWRRYGRFEIILDGAGNLAGFVDHDKYRDAGDAPLSREDAADLVIKAGVVPASARLEDYKSADLPSGTGKTWKALYILDRPAKAFTHLEVEINASRKTIIAVKPKFRERPHG